MEHVFLLILSVCGAGLFWITTKMHEERQRRLVDRVVKNWDKIEIELPANESLQFDDPAVLRHSDNISETTWQFYYHKETDQPVIRDFFENRIPVFLTEDQKTQILKISKQAIVTKKFLD